MKRVAALLGGILGRGGDFEDGFREEFTGLFLKEYWDQRLRVEQERVTRSGGALGMALVRLRFHPEVAEDTSLRCSVVQAAGAIIRENLRIADVAARQGYDLHVLFPDTDSLGVMFVAGRIKERLDAWLFEHAATVGDRVQVLAGVASFPDDVSDPSSLVAAVSKALDHAGRSGDGRLVCYGRASEEVGL